MTTATEIHPTTLVAERYLKPQQFCEIYNIAPRTAERWRVTGDGPKWVRIGPRRVAYRLADCEAWGCRSHFRTPRRRARAWSGGMTGHLRGSAGKSAPSLSRHVFKTSRLAEFCSRKELVNQTGHAAEDWPLVILKELVDNALDGAEEAGTAPIIEIKISQDEIAVTDNGPGIAPETVADIIDYTARVSSREAYVSPTRGAQGNALKTILAMPFALDRDRGETIIESQCAAHRIGFSIDRIRQEPRISRVCETSLVKSGARITLRWPISACSILDGAKARFLQVAEDYTWVNPHLTLTVEWVRSGETIGRTIAATNPAWKKWRPLDPTSPPAAWAPHGGSYRPCRGSRAGLPNNEGIRF
jgi:Histidine kinase-, DNA gyrase B-, and HSP90-like ATPase